MANDYDYGSVEDLRGAEIDLSVDEILRVLSDRHARTVIAHLHAEPEATLDQLAAIAAGELAVADGTVATESDYERIRIRLHHATLPRLDDHGLLEFDPETGTVSEPDIPEPIYSFLGVDADR